MALTGEPVQFESHAAALDRWYAASAFSPHKGYFAVTFSDITARKRAEEELSRANQRLQTLAQDLQTVNGALIDSDRRKNEFLAVLSHELRNPLAPIVNSLYMLEHAPAGKRQGEAEPRQVIDRQVGHLSHLVDDLLDVTRVSRNKIQLERRASGPVRRRSAAASRTSARCSRPAGSSSSRASRREPLFVNADATRVAQVVGNLLQNAAKFTPPRRRHAASA